MGFKIFRGALLGIVLGVLFAVSVSGAMYMKIMIEEDIKDQETTKTLAVETAGVNQSGNAFTGQITGDYAYYLGAEILDMDYEAMETEAIPECNSAEDVLLRFHVKAHSNKPEDLELKYKVRDAVLAQIGEDLEQLETREETILYLNENLESIKDIADTTIKENGYGYTTKVYITNDYFPIRQYGELVFPAGYYEALRIDIGLAEGENFWCVLYPMMCYPVDGGGVVTREDQQELKKELSYEDYEKLFINKEVPKEDVEIRFKLLEWLNFYD